MNISKVKKKEKSLKDLKSKLKELRKGKEEELQLKKLLSIERE